MASAVEILFMRQISENSDILDMPTEIPGLTKSTEYPHKEQPKLLIHIECSQSFNRFSIADISVCIFPTVPCCYCLSLHQLGC